MPLAATLPAAVLETILIRLAALFLAGAGDDMTAARQAAAEMLAAYRPQTAEELCLAANIIGFSFQALEALGQAAAPDTSLTRTLRLRGSAVSLSRESHKAERRLEQLQKARRSAEQAIETQPASAQPEPKSNQPETTGDRQITVQASHRTGIQTEEDRQRDIRIAAGLNRLEARMRAQAGIATLPQPPNSASAMLSAA